MKAKHGGVPKDYKGKREEFIEETKKALAAKKGNHATALTSEDDAQSEYTESDFGDYDDVDEQDQPPSCTAILAAASSKTTHKVGKRQSASRDDPSASQDASGAAGGDEPEEVLKGWAHSVQRASASKQTKLRKVDRRVQADSRANMMLLHQMLTANMNHNV